MQDPESHIPLGQLPLQTAAGRAAIAAPMVENAVDAIPAGEYPYYGGDIVPVESVIEFTERTLQTHCNSVEEAIAQGDDREADVIAFMAITRSALEVEVTRGTYTAKELYGCLREANKLDQLTHGRAMAWRMLSGASTMQLGDMIHNDERAREMVDSMLRRGVRSTDFDDGASTREFISAAENVFVAAHGQTGMSPHWMTKSGSSVPEYMRPVVKSPHFMPYVIDQRLERTAHLKVMNRDHTLRSFETHILTEMLHLPKKMAVDFQLAFGMRRMKKIWVQHEPHVVPYDQGGGVDEEQWAKSLKRYAFRVREYGVARVTRWREEFGIVELDTIPETDLNALDAMMNRDEKFLEEIKNKDVVITVRQRYGDTGNGDMPESHHIATTAAEEDAVSLTVETGSYDETREILEKMHDEYGVRAAKLIFLQHGLPSGLAYDRVGANFLQKQEMADKRIGEQIADLMVPSKRDGSRTLIMLVCYQAAVENKPESEEGILAAVMTSHGLPSGGIAQKSPALVLAETSRPDQALTVVAADESIWVHNDGIGIRFANVHDQMVRANIFTRRKHGVSHSKQSHIPLGKVGRPV